MADRNRVLARKIRNSYFISTISIAMVLFLLGAVGYLIINAMVATQRMKESVTINVMLRDGLDSDQIRAIRAALEANSAVRDILFVDKEQAAKEFKEYLGGDFVEFLQYNPLPDAFEVRLNASSYERELVSELERKFSEINGVDEIVYQRNILDQIGANISRFNLILLLFGGTLLTISVILLNNTVRVTIYSKRYIINTMKLVGATRGFILRPFVWSALWQGLTAALVATILFAASVIGLNRGLPEIKFANSEMQLFIIVAAMFVGGVLISVLFTIFAVNRFIKLQSNQIHLF